MRIGCSSRPRTSGRAARAISDILEEQPLSAATGRSIEEIAAGKGAKRVWHSNRSAGAKADGAAAFKQRIKQIAARPAARARTNAKPGARGAGGKRGRKKPAAGDPKSKLPEFVPLSLATLYDQAPSGPQWLHEIKFDGYRMEARLDHGSVRLLTRKQQDWTHRFKPIAEAVAALPAETALLDGEVVVEDERGISNFSLLQTDLKDGRSDRFAYYVFDLLYLDGRDLTAEPLVARKAALARLLKGKGGGVIRYTDDFAEAGPLILRHACEMGLEGIVSKRRDAPYRSGRTDNFVKSKCHGRQEFIIAGYTPSTALPNAIGALTVAVHEDGALRYAGRVGTGYTQKMARELFKRLQPLRTDRRPVALPADERRKDVVWVEPKLVVEAEFAGVTHGGVLRQASFKGIREDKAASEVVREVPAPLRKSTGTKTMVAKAPAQDPPSNQPKTPSAVRSKNSDEAGRLHLTHPDRVYWADVGVTKQDLAEYYVSVWDWIRPHIVGRALSLLRAPEGVGGETFFQKHIACEREVVAAAPCRRRQGSRRDRGRDARRSHRGGAIRRARDPRARFAARQPGDLRPPGVRSRSGAGGGLAADRRGGARDARAAEGGTARELRQAVRRQGCSRRGADRRCRLGHGQAVHPAHRRGDGCG